MSDELSNEWETIKGFPDYRINKNGDILSCKYGREKMLSLTRSKIGYLQVTLNSYHKKYVHHLMAIQYLNHIPTKQLQVNHKDGNKINNKLSNLEIISPRQNTNHAIKIGTHKDQKGENNYYAKLSNKQVKEIKYLIYFGYKVKYIAEYYSVSTSTIYLIAEGKTWRNVL